MRRGSAWFGRLKRCACTATPAARLWRQALDILVYRLNRIETVAGQGCATRAGV